MMNPWHQVSPGEKAPYVVNSIIEIPRGSRGKYELDKESGLLILDRVIYSSVYYPHNYGFIPQSLGEDHDPIDILVLSQIEVVPLCIVPSKVIGVMRMLDNGEADDKIIAVAEHDMSVNHLDDISELPVHFAKELRSFFEDYKKLEHKTVEVKDFLGKQIALDIISQGFKDYEEKY